MYLIYSLVVTLLMLSLISVECRKKTAVICYLIVLSGGYCHCQQYFLEVQMV